MLSAMHILMAQVASIAVLFAAVFGHKWCNLPFKVTAVMVALVALFLLLSALLSLLALLHALLRSRPVLLWCCTLGVSGLPVLLFGAVVGFTALSSPRIHDISTRFDPPLAFEHAQALRLPSENSLSQPSAEVIAQQRAYYTRLQPLVLPEPLASCFARGLAEVNALGWRTVWVSDVDEFKIIEAVEESALFGFKDDMRIEFAKRGLGCEVNMRSVSRVGVGDLGANAKRIERFFALMRD